MKCLGMEKAIHDGKAKEILHPCGRCIGCLINKRDEKTTKFVYHHKYSKGNFFGTLTYSNIALADIIEKYGDIQIMRTHIQKFNKKLRMFAWRKYKAKFEIGYSFHYGDTTGRPHFHPFIFNWPGTLQELDLISLKYWYHGDLARIWERSDGDPSLGNYIGKHIIDTRGNKGDIHGYGLKPYSVSPKHMGAKYIEVFRDFHQADIDRNYVPDPRGGGSKMRMPKEWRSKLYTEEQLIRQRSRLQIKAEKKDDKISFDEARKIAHERFEVYRIEKRKRDMFNGMHNSFRI